MAVVLQLSDPHLLAEPDALLRGVPTRKTLADVLAHALALHPEPDAVVLTGDLAHDEHPSTYAALRTTLGPHAARALPLPGNHDDRGALRAAFPELGGAGEDAVCFTRALGGWRLVGLDSRIPGEDAGRLGPQQLAWLHDTLVAHAHVPTVIFVHHPPVPTGHPWLDTMGLLDADALAAVLALAPWVRALCHGHIHRELEARLGAVPVLGAPSTAFQFPAHPDEGAYELRPPGARVLHLSDDGLRTEVVRLPALDHPPIERQTPAAAEPG